MNNELLLLESRNSIGLLLLMLYELMLSQVRVGTELRMFLGQISLGFELLKSDFQVKMWYK